MAAFGRLHDIPVPDKRVPSAADPVTRAPRIGLRQRPKALDDFHFIAAGSAGDVVSHTAPADVCHCRPVNCRNRPAVYCKCLHYVCHYCCGRSSRGILYSVLLISYEVILWHDERLSRLLATFKVELAFVPVGQYPIFGDANGTKPIQCCVYSLAYIFYGLKQKLLSSDVIF